MNLRDQLTEANGIAEEALDQLDFSRNALRQLESLLWTMKEALKASAADRHLSRLAELGAGVALEIGDITESNTRKLRSDLETVGAAQ